MIKKPKKPIDRSNRAELVFRAEMIFDLIGIFQIENFKKPSMKSRIRPLRTKISRIEVLIKIMWEIFSKKTLKTRPI
jgi:hypothetical protein